MSTHPLLFNMSAIENAKPPRPCTEYNIYFQLERAYILQVVLHSEPCLDGAEPFHPSQQTYTGLPSLPGRYVSLVLPYDWHLPGKEKRRKRKHRKSHGAISFHDLSSRIANAWKVADDEIKTYCSQVCAVGMIRYKAAMKEWKRSGGGQKAKQQGKVESQRKSHRQRMMAKMSSVSVSSHASASSQELISSESVTAPFVKPNKLEAVTNTNTLMNIQNVPEEEVPIPTDVQSQVVTMEELDRAFENDIFGMWNDVTIQEPVSIVQPNFVGNLQGIKIRNASIVSKEPDDIMEDNDIISMWDKYDQQVSSPPVVVATPAITMPMPKSNNIMASNYAVNADEFGLKGYTQTMRDMQQMLEQQWAEEMKKATPPVPQHQQRRRRNSIVACSA